MVWWINGQRYKWLLVAWRLTFNWIFCSQHHISSPHSVTAPSAHAALNTFQKNHRFIYLYSVWTGLQFNSQNKLPRSTRLVRHRCPLKLRLHGRPRSRGRFAVSIKILYTDLRWCAVKTSIVLLSAWCCGNTDRCDSYREGKETSSQQTADVNMLTDPAEAPPSTEVH